jgi:membrane-associated protease RseP (regulator of RpoE activity)
MTDTHRGDRSPDASSSPADEATADGATASPEAPVATDPAAPPAYPLPPGAGEQTGPGWPPVGPGSNRPNAYAAPRPPREGEGAYATGGLRLALVVGLVVLATWSWGWPILAMIGGVVVMIFLHELGHFLSAKWSGMKVTEFFIGFGPRIWSFRRGETEYGLKVLPAGAYVRIIGMNNLDEVDPADEARTYRQQSFPKRLLTVSAGSLMHMLQAFVLLVIALGLVGVPGGSIVDTDETDARSWEVTGVTEGSAAADAGLRDGDHIVAVDGTAVSDLGGDLSDVVTGYEVGDEVAFTIENDGSERTVTAELGARPADVAGGVAGSPFLGVGSAPEFDDSPIGLGHALVQAPGEMVRFTGESLGALVGFFSPDGLGDFASNVNNANEDADRSASGSGAAAEPRDGEDNRMMSIYGVVRLGAELGERGGAVAFLLLFFQINIFIGLFNMLPLLPFDGGHAAVATYERIRSRRGRRYHADMAKLMPLTYAVVMALVLLGVTSIYLDIVNPVDL